MSTYTPIPDADWRPIYFDKETHGSKRFYWHCWSCEETGYETRVDFAYTAGKTHAAVRHGR